MVLQVPDEPALQLYQAKLALAGLRHVPIREVDPPYTNQLTAIGLVPTADRSSIKKVLSSLPLLGAEAKAKALSSKEDRAPCAGSSAG